MDILIGIVVFVYGLVFGSFFNVVGYRLPNNLSLIKPRDSFCPNCFHQLRWIELIPVLSYIIQKGKCRSCHKKIALFYPLIESLTGILFLLSYLLFGISTEFVIALLVSSYFVIVLVSDGKYMIIPDEVTLFFCLALLFVRIAAYGPVDTLRYVISGVTIFLFVLLFMRLANRIFNKESLGGGDIKLELFTGLLLGLSNGLFSVFIGSAAALPFAILNQRVNKTNVIAFGPFLLFGALVIYLFGLDIISILKDLSYLYY